MMLKKTYLKKPIDAIMHNGKVLLVDGHYRLLAATLNVETDMLVRFIGPQEFALRAREFKLWSTPQALESFAERVKKIPDMLPGLHF